MHEVDSNVNRELSQFDLEAEKVIQKFRTKNNGSSHNYTRSDQTTSSYAYPDIQTPKTRPNPTKDRTKKQALRAKLNNNDGKKIDNS